MVDRAARLLALSSEITGASAFELRGSGLLDVYLAALDARLPPGLLDELLAADDVETILDDQKLGPVARNLIVVWYCGSWTAMPADWIAAHGDFETGKIGVISADAYLGGLQWSIAGAHPAGAQQQGFGAWSLPPEAPRP